MALNDVQGPPINLTLGDGILSPNESINMQEIQCPQSMMFDLVNEDILEPRQISYLQQLIDTRGPSSDGYCSAPATSGSHQSMITVMNQQPDFD